MPDEKDMYYKNPARNNDSDIVRKPYVPQYRQMNIVPEKVAGATLPSNVLIARGGSSDDNPRNRKMSISQPYADVSKSSIGNSQIPNVGNNMEQTWSYIDGDIVDDISGEIVGALDSNTPMIDNNDFITLPGEPVSAIGAKPQDEQSKAFMTENDLMKEVINEDNNFSALKDDSYILIASGTVVSVSDKQSIQDEACALIFGEHPLCDGQAISAEDVVVLKKVKIKIGLFLE